MKDQEVWIDRDLVKEALIINQQYKMVNLKAAMLFMMTQIVLHSEY